MSEIGFLNKVKVGLMSLAGLAAGVVIGRHIVVTGQASLSEVVGMESKVILVGVAIGTLMLGFKGFHKWQPEAVGKRKLELAEDLLVNVYKFRDVVTRARSPFGYEGDGETRKRESTANLDPDKEASKDRYYTTVERLYKEESFLPEFFALSFRARAFWGEPMNTLFSDALDLIGEIQNTVQELMDNVDSRHMSKEAMISSRRIIYGGFKDDPITPKLADLVEGFEGILGEVLMQNFGLDSGQSKPTGDP